MSGQKTPDPKKKAPAFQFYPGDWRRDFALQRCAPRARCLWLEMLCLMHDGTPYGHLATESGPIRAARELAALVAGFSSAMVKHDLAELEAAGVFSRTSEGVIYSRRMVRDEALRMMRAKGGPLSLEHPNVPRPKVPIKDAHEGTHDGPAKGTHEGIHDGGDGRGSPAARQKQEQKQKQETAGLYQGGNFRTEGRKLQDRI